MFSLLEVGSVRAGLKGVDVYLMLRARRRYSELWDNWDLLSEAQISELQYLWLWEGIWMWGWELRCSSWEWWWEWTCLQVSNSAPMTQR